MKRQIIEKIKQNINLFSSVCEWYFTRLFISRLIAIISLANLGVVAFDLTYIPLRDIWLNGKITLGKFKIGPYKYDGFQLKILRDSWSQTITKYDVIKGIEPYRDTQQYLDEVDKLIANLKNNDLNTSQARDILAKLRIKSIEMIEEDPFKLANKSGNLEKIKNIMREHMANYIDNPDDSSKVAFSSFWTEDHLRNNTTQELNFFNQEIRPLINTNYYRPLGETGEFVDYFGLIDFPFVMIIFVDFIIRCIAISFRYHGVKFQDAILWRWYDLIFFLPTFRWLRIIPVTIRLDDAKLLDFGAIKKQASQGFVAGIAGDITEVVVLRVFEQVQNVIKEGQIEKMLTPAKDQREYIDLNDTNEIAEISKLLVNIVAYKVLPEIRGEVENLLVYTFEKTIKESPVYKNVEHLPGLKTFPHNISNRLATQLYQIFLDTIDNLLQEDPIFDEYLEKIIIKFAQTIQLSTATEYDIHKIEQLLVALLEEVKVNYVQKLSEGDIEALLDEKRALQQQNQ